MFDKAGMDAYDKIKMVPKGQRVVADGVMCWWFTNESGLELVDHARRLMHPDPPKKEEVLFEHIEIWQGK